MARPTRSKQPPQRNALGLLLRHAREEKGWSQADLARKLQLLGWDVERTVITKIELRRRCITDYELLLIIRALGGPLDQFSRVPVSALTALTSAT